jgi:acetyl-CoA carboxylase biotin carboxyl carrier protein
VFHKDGEILTLNREQNSVSTDAEIHEIREITSIVNGLISMMSAGNIGSLKLEYGSLRLSLRSTGDTFTDSSQSPAGRPAQSFPASHASEPELDSSEHIVSAPMIGTFYVAPAPNEPPYVLPGDEVVEGQTIGIIEAMKIMNEIAADRAGTIVEIIASDGQTVEYGSPLLRVKPAVE